MRAFALNRNAVIAGRFALRARCLEIILADSAFPLLDVPEPSRHGIPFDYIDFQCLKNWKNELVF